jgi:hypothetical protein
MQLSRLMNGLSGMAIQQDASDESEEHEHDDAQLTLLNEQINGTGGLLEGANPQTGPVIQQSGEFAISDKTLSAVRQLYFHPIVSGISATTKMLGTSNYKVVDKTSEFDSMVSDVSALQSSVNDYYEWTSMPTTTDFQLRGPEGVILVQSTPYRLWHSNSAIWKKNNLGGATVLPTGFYNCVITMENSVTSGGSFWLFRGMFRHIQSNVTANDDDPSFSVEITQVYHANHLGSGIDSGKASIIYRPNDEFTSSGENNDAANTTETYIKWSNAPSTSNDKVQLRFRMIPILSD